MNVNLVYLLLHIQRQGQMPRVSQLIYYTPMLAQEYAADKGKNWFRAWAMRSVSTSQTVKGRPVTL